MVIKENLAPVLAEIYLNDFEKKFIQNNYFIQNYFYYRYVDKIFLIVPNDTNFQNNLDILNNLDKTIKFTCAIEKIRRYHFEMF